MKIGRGTLRLEEGEAVTAREVALVSVSLMREKESDAPTVMVLIGFSDEARPAVLVPLALGWR